jgi:hypothetical protein
MIGNLKHGIRNFKRGTSLADLLLAEVKKPKFKKEHDLK